MSAGVLDEEEMSPDLGCDVLMTHTRDDVVVPSSGRSPLGCTLVLGCLAMVVLTVSTCCDGELSIGTSASGGNVTSSSSSLIITSDNVDN
jgi:hypothetical protein